MTVITYLLSCLAEFFDAWVGNGANSDWLSIFIAFILIAITFAMYFHVYWRIVSPKCYKLWLCTVFSFTICVLIWVAFIVLCIGGEWIITAIF